MYTNSHNFVHQTSNTPNDRYNNFYRNYTEQQQMMLGGTSGSGTQTNVSREHKAVQTDPDYPRTNLLQKLEALTNELKKNNLNTKLATKNRRLSI